MFESVVREGKKYVFRVINQFGSTRRVELVAIYPATAAI